MIPSATENFIDYFANKDSPLKEYPTSSHSLLIIVDDISYPLTTAICASGLLLLITIDRTLLCMYPYTIVYIIYSLRNVNLLTLVQRERILTQKCETTAVIHTPRNHNITVTNILPHILEARNTLHLKLHHFPAVNTAV